MNFPVVVLQAEDKVMPLDLSCVKPSVEADVINDDDADKDDEIIVTLAIPGRHHTDTSRHCHEPIVIPSDSEDSDSDVTILSDVAPVATSRTASTKSAAFGEVLGIAIAGPSDDADGDCFVSSFQCAPKHSNTSKRCFTGGGAHAGIKRIYEDSSSQSSVASLDSSVDDSLVHHRDPFLLDASSNDDIGFVLPSVDTKTSAAAAVFSHGGQRPSVDRYDVSANSETVKLDQSNLAATEHSDTLLHDTGNTLPTKSTAVSLLSTPMADSLTFGITQLLSSQQTPANDSISVDRSACFVTTALANATVPSATDCISTVDASAITDLSSVHNIDNVAGSYQMTCRRDLDRTHNLALSGDEVGDGALPGKGWTVQSKGDCRVLLRRSVSCINKAKTTRKLSTTSCKRRRRMSVDVSTTDCSAASTVSSSLTPDVIDSCVMATETSLCYGCRSSISVSQLSYCMAGHGCCGQCLQTQVKTLLASGKKGTLKCRYTSCSSFYLVSQLHNSLPSMVVEILEEKLDREYCDNAAKLMLKTVGKDLLGAFSDDDFDERSSYATSSRAASKDDCSILDLPKNWEQMAPKEEYRLVELLRSGSEEYNWVAALFHQSMTRPRAQITKIQRVQNQILWQFYMVKKKQMERDSNRPVTEKNLFHGTCGNVVDAICRYNFDWRLCGAHGTMYGQGSYFARDAAYSHMYTDQPESRSRRHQNQPAPTMVFNGPPVSAPSHHQLSAAHTPGTASSATQMLFQAFPGSSHAVSIAALHSCRFAHLQGSMLNPTSSSSSGTPAGGPAPSFPMNLSSYWLPPGLVQPTQPQQPTSQASSTNSASTHVHTVFLARVLVGDYTLGKNIYRKPPPVDPSQPFGRCYDSCVNDQSNPTIFVIFNNAQCYPDYIIQYTNKPRDSL